MADIDIKKPSADPWWDKNKAMALELGERASIVSVDATLLIYEFRDSCTSRLVKGRHEIENAEGKKDQIMEDIFSYGAQMRKTLPEKANINPGNFERVFGQLYGAFAGNLMEALSRSYFSYLVKNYKDLELRYDNATWAGSYLAGCYEWLKRADRKPILPYIDDYVLHPPVKRSND